MGAGGRWVDRDAGPVVRPYALTGGRTSPVGEVLDLVAVIVAAGGGGGGEDGRDLAPEHTRILGLCQRPVTVVDVASSTELPVGVVRVLLADLIGQGMVMVLPQRPPEEQPSAELLKEVLHGLRAL